MVAAVHLFGVSGAEAQTKPSRPGAERPASMRVNSEPPLVLPRESGTERQFAKTQRAWSERVLAAPFHSRMEGKPLATEAKQWVAKALDIWPGNTFGVSYRELRQSGQTLLDGGCDDPLVRYLAAWTRWQDSGQPGGAAETLKKLLPEVEAMERSSSLARIVAAHLYEARKESGKTGKDLPDQIATLTVKSWTDGDFLPEEDLIFARQVISVPGYKLLDEEPTALMREVEASNLPEWIRSAVLGRGAVNLAWEARGGGYANTVDDAGWRQFHAHLAEARKHLVKAWELKPNAPEAPSGMVAVVMAESAESKETGRLWLDRTIAAQLDYLSAYGRLGNFYLPRWGGSPEKVLDLARRCVETKRYDTGVPWAGRIIIENLFREMPDWHQLYEYGDVAKLMLEIDRGYANEPSRKHERPQYAARFLVDAWLAGEYEKAASVLPEVGDREFTPNLKKLLTQCGVDEAFVRSEIPVLASAAKGSYLAAREAYKKAQLPQAIAAYEKALSQVPEGSRGFLKSQIAIAKIEQKLEKGEWVNLLDGSIRSSWFVRLGNFSFDGAAPKAHDNHGPARVVHGARVGPAFELRGELAVAGEPLPERTFGLIFGDELYGEGNQRWHGCEVTYPDGSEPIGFLSHRGGFAAKYQPVEPKDVNQFEITMKDGAVSWSLNGKSVYSAEKLRIWNAQEGRVGMGMFFSAPGVSQTLRKLEVRRIPAVTNDR